MCSLKNVAARADRCGAPTLIKIVREHDSP
jgi:hypothetical protein